MPIYTSPVGLAKLVHPAGKCAIAAAAGKKAIIQIVNTVSSIPIETIMDARVSHSQPLFWQLYVDRDLKKSEDFIKRVEKAGVKSIWLTVDSPVVGNRESDERAKGVADVSSNLLSPGTSGTSQLMCVSQISEAIEEVVETPQGQGIAKANTGFINARIDWSIIPWLRSVTKLPIAVKGIQSVEDALAPYEHKMDGIVLSNHGGRSQDTAQPPLLTLLEINHYAPHLVDRNSNMQVFIDGGIR